MDSPRERLEHIVAFQRCLGLQSKTLFEPCRGFLPRAILTGISNRNQCPSGNASHEWIIVIEQRSTVFDNRPPSRITPQFLSADLGGDAIQQFRADTRREFIRLRGESIQYCDRLRWRVG